MEIEIQLWISYLGYFAIFLLMALNGSISFPSSEIVYPVAGSFIALGNLEFYGVIISGVFGNTLGNIILYFVGKKKRKEHHKKQILEICYFFDTG